MIPPENVEWNGVEWSLVSRIFLFISLFIFIKKAILKVDQKEYQYVNYNFNIILMTNTSHFLMTILLKNYGK